MLWHFFLRILKGEFNADVCFAVIVENGVRLRLNIVDTPGYGDQVNNEGWCVPKFPVKVKLFSIGYMHF